MGGWTSKEHITAAVIFDRDQDAYVGVFNKNIIKIWKEDSDNLDKVKKYKVNFVQVFLKTSIIFVSDRHVCTMFLMLFFPARTNIVNFLSVSSQHSKISP